VTQEWFEGVQWEPSSARTTLGRVSPHTLDVLLEASPHDDARIDACTDLATSERWFDRAITATSVSDVLG
jgi:hypothetical protein